MGRRCKDNPSSKLVQRRCRDILVFGDYVVSSQGIQYTGYGKTRAHCVDPQEVHAACQGAPSGPPGHGCCGCRSALPSVAAPLKSQELLTLLQSTKIGKVLNGLRKYPDSRCVVARCVVALAKHVFHTWKQAIIAMTKGKAALPLPPAAVTNYTCEEYPASEPTACPLALCICRC
ncbi:hypothetical protein GOP47_0031030 [Adiantum capillus-veneris]|nr:hypothetical protein GOP47_0031030 [Adiantum capillus-veneris]